MNDTLATHIERLYSNIKQVIDKGKDTAYRAVNATMVEVYWQIGKLIVEEEQGGKEKSRLWSSFIGRTINSVNQRIWKKL